MTEEQFIKELEQINISLTQEQLSKLELFYKLLIDWNKKINLTRIIEKKDIYLKHFYDSLTIVKVIDITKVDTLCDVGTGAGFPGIVLKIAFPNLKITLLDALQKRVNYLNSIIKELELEDIEALHVRGEDLKEKYDVVTARAVANIEKLLKYTMHLLNKDGVMIAMKGNIDEELTTDVKKTINLKYKHINVEKFLLPIENSNRSLILIKNK